MEAETFHSCYKPQAEMRIVFQCYALFGALVMTLLCGIVAFDIAESTQEFIAKHTINLCYLVAGPLLLVFV